MARKVMEMEIKQQYDLYERYKTCVYCDSDETGNITRLECGQHIIPSSDYIHFFRVDRYVTDTIQNYKVVWNGRVAALQAIDLEREKAEMEAKIKMLEKQIAAQQVAPIEKE